MRIRRDVGRTRNREADCRQSSSPLRGGGHARPQFGEVCASASRAAKPGSMPREPTRATTTERGYGWNHQRLRARLEPVVRSGNAVCVRCGEPILPNEKWDLGHHDYDRNQYTGAEHRACNRSTAGRRSKGYPLKWSRRWFDDPPPGTTSVLGPGRWEVYLGHGVWEETSEGLTERRRLELRSSSGRFGSSLPKPLTCPAPV